MKIKQALVIFLVATMLISVVSTLPPTGAVTITETFTGENILNITFPTNGGVSTDVRFLIQADAHVVNASLDIEGMASTQNGSIRHATQADFETGEGENVTISNGELTLQQLDGQWITLEGWGDTDLTNVSIIGDMAVLSRYDEPTFLSNKRVDTNGIGGQKTSKIAVDPAGKIHVVFEKDSNIEYMTSIDNGTTWVMEGTFGVSISAYKPSVYAGPNGYIHVFYYGAGGGGSPLFYKLSMNNGSSFTDMSPGVMPSGLDIVWDSKGIMHFVGYSSSTMFPPFTYTVFYWNSTDNGSTISSLVKINDDPGDFSIKWGPSIAIDSNDKIHVVWHDNRSSMNWWEKEIFYSNSTDHVTFSPNRAIESISGVGCGDPTVAVDSNDKVHVVWLDNRTGDFDIYYTNSTDGGVIFKNSWAINDKTNFDQLGPSMDIGPDDTIHVEWLDGSAGTNADVAYTNSSDSGTSFMGSILANDDISASQESSEMVLDYDGAPHFVWADDRNGGWKVYHTRIALPFIPEGRITGTADLCTTPESLDRLFINADVLDHTGVRAEIRTSSDNVSWTGWENVDLDDSTILILPDRYVNWVVILNTTDPMASPSVANLSIEYTHYMTEGLFLSGLLETEHPVSKATVFWNATSNYPYITIRMSNDNGTTWTDVEKGEAVVFPEVQKELRYMLIFSSYGGFTPVFSDIDILYSSLVHPTDLELDVGPDSTVDWEHPDEMDTKETIYFTDALNSILESGGGMAGDIQIIMKFSSNSTGTISVSNIRIVLDLPPVIHDSVPEGATSSMDEDSYLVFEVNASDPDGLDLTYRWFFNDTEVTSVTGPTYNHTTTFDDEGKYPVRVDVSDERFTVNRTWTLTVMNVNRAPEIVSTEPIDKDITIEIGDPLSLKINAVDPDGDILEFSWIVDDDVVPEWANISWDIDYGILKVPGVYNVSVKVSDGEYEVYRTWNTTVKAVQNNRPTIAPIPDRTVKLGSSFEYQVEAHDADPQDNLTFRLENPPEGMIITPTGVIEWTPRKAQVGKHTITVNVSDGKDHTTTQFKINVKDMEDPTVFGMDTTMLLAIIIAIIVAVILVVLAVIMKRKGKGEEVVPEEEQPVEQQEEHPEEKEEEEKED